MRSLLIETDTLVLNLIGAKREVAIRTTLKLSLDCLAEMKQCFENRHEVFDEGSSTAHHHFLRLEQLAQTNLFRFTGCNALHQDLLTIMEGGGSTSKGISTPTQQTRLDKSAKFVRDDEYEEFSFCQQMRP